MFQTCRISWQDATRSDKYSVLSYVVLSFSSALIARSLRAQHHISGKTTFRTLCAGAHKEREIRLSGSEGGAKLSFVPTPITRTWRQYSFEDIVRSRWGIEPIHLPGSESSAGSYPGLDREIREGRLRFCASPGGKSDGGRFTPV
jgi:hypothetical protein